MRPRLRADRGPSGAREDGALELVRFRGQLDRRGIRGRLKAPVITGESAVTALGRTLVETRAALAAGRSAIAPVEEDGAPRAADRSPAARIGAFTTEPELPKSKARRLDLGSQYAVVAVRQALADAGYAIAGREE